MPSIERAGARIAYQKVGAGPSVLLLQGVGCAGETWRPQLDQLAARYTLIAVDNRGVGDSTRGDGPLTIEVMAEDALAVMDAESLARLHVVGHSMGGLIAQEVALSAMARYDASARLGTLAALRTVVVSAEHDRIALPRFGRALADAIPGAHYIEIADAGHGVPIQRAQQVNALLAEHFG